MRYGGSDRLFLLKPAYALATIIGSPMTTSPTPSVTDAHSGRRCCLPRTARMMIPVTVKMMPSLRSRSRRPLVIVSSNDVESWRLRPGPIGFQAVASDRVKVPRFSPFEDSERGDRRTPAHVRNLHLRRSCGCLPSQELELSTSQRTTSAFGRIPGGAPGMKVSSSRVGPDSTGQATCASQLSLVRTRVLCIGPAGR